MNAQQMVEVEQDLRSLRQAAQDEGASLRSGALATLLYLLERLAEGVIEERRQRRTLAVALERLAAAEAAYRWAHDRDPHKTELRWRALWRAGDQARALLASEGVRQAACAKGPTR